MSAGYGIEDLKSQITSSGGLARGNQFMVTLPQLNNFFVSTEELNLMCTTVGLPGRQIMSMDYPMGTRNRKIANGYTTTDMTLTFLVANNHIVRKYFEAWQSEAHDQVTREIGYYNDYTKRVTISTVEKGVRLSLYKRQFGGGLNRVPSFIRNRLPDIGPFDLSQGEVDLGAKFPMKTTYSCTLLDCYPTTLSDQQLGNNEAGVLELTVQLSFSEWESTAGEFTDAGEATTRGLIGAGVSALGRLFG